MRQLNKMYAVLFMQLLLSIFCQSCEDNIKALEITNIDIKKDGLIDVGASLHIKAMLSTRSSDPSLCIGRTPRCYPLDTADTECSYITGGIECNFQYVVNQSADERQNDNPFVDYPDDWDTMYINNIKTYGITVTGLEITLSSPIVNPTKTYTFVSFTGSNYIEAQGKMNLVQMIKERRECTLKSAFCGYDDNDCHSGEVCNSGGYSTVDDVSMDIFPLMVQEAAYDIGQMGILKYDPMDNSIDNGCGEFYRYYASQYSNNIHYTCTISDNTCAYWRYEDCPGCTLATVPEQWIYSGRGYKTTYKTVAGARKFDGLKKCNYVDLCATVDSTKTYTPKIGDYLYWKWGAGGGDSHVMMAVGEFVPTGGVGFKIPIIDKGELVTTSILQITAEYYFFFGEADNELGGGDPLDIGRPDENSSFRATMTSVINN